VVDASSPRYAGRIEVVHTVLEGVLRDGKDHAAGEERIPTILVLNKRDLIGEEAEREGLKRKHPEAVLVSAARKEGIDGLLSAIESRIEMDTVAAEVRVSTDDGRGIAAVERNARVLSRRVVDGFLHFDVTARRRDVSLLERVGEVKLRPMRTDRSRERR
jgi:50S ribosomal subunit-associated GTPase HflX